MTFEIRHDPIDPESLKRRLEHRSAGACATFEGWVRDHNEGEAVTALEYEAYEPVAVAEGREILAEAMRRFDVIAAHAEHRVGVLAIGDCAVWVGVTAAHRGAAFDACRFIIDEIKQRVPIWKKEHYADGASGWVNCATGAPRGEARPPRSGKGV
ncbi:MAG TPA: molybdenum cofactor biosynthesis protein MoaE [Gammaproteobacteria bacterium]